MTNKAILIITDGIGHNHSNNFNAFSNAKTPTYDYLFEKVPYSLIHTYGEHVGLPQGQMGNSEVGHMTIGSGRTLYQDLVKINISVKDNTLKDNEVLNVTIENSNNVHLIGLVSDGGVHSHINHVIALAKIAEAKNKNVFIHIITDGRDVAPNCASKYIQQIMDICNENISISSIAGRYYAMDRDNRWERVKKSYDSISFAKPKSKKNILEYIEESYKNDVFDEFIEPTSFDNYEGIKENDSIIFCNFRSDRMREISSCFANKGFKEFEVFNKNLYIATMTEYDKNLPLPILFPKDNPKNILAEIIADAGLTQVHTAETEKYAHVTFFFNGGIEEPVLNETRILIPSPDVATYDLKPEMSAPQVGEAVRDAIKNETDFIVVNFANGDMVGHTGDFEASVKAVETVDCEIGKILQKSDKKGYNVLITSDHGNCEELKDRDKNPLTNHTTYDVYCFLKAYGYEKIKNGGLSNIAPTILKLMNLPIPSEMEKPLI